MEDREDRTLEVFVYVVVVIATIADAASDAIMPKLFAPSGSISLLPPWTAAQWWWHVAKWISFNVPLGAFAVFLVGWKRTAWLAGVCWFIWEIVYRSLLNASF